MNHQLIITILGADKRGILCELARALSETNCNILDSRQGVYGKDFSLTMIIEGSHTAITKAELRIPALCQSLDLLSMMKRTSQHSKQNLERMLDVEISGVDAAGLVERVSTFFSEHNGFISAFRQKAFAQGEGNKDLMRCKMVVSVPTASDVSSIKNDFSGLINSLNLEGKVTDKHEQESNEQITNWQ